MKKTALCLAILFTFLSFGLTILSHATELPAIPLTTSRPEDTRIAGDANKDGTVDLRDPIVILRSLVGGWDVTIDSSAADVNADGKVNLKDVTLLRRYLVGGWGVTLQ